MFHMKKTAKITKENYQKLINNVNCDLDFHDGLTRFYYENKDGFVWSYRFFRVGIALFQVKSRLGHQKENWSYCGTLETIFEHILNS